MAQNITANKVEMFGVWQHGLNFDFDSYMTFDVNLEIDSDSNIIVCFPREGCQKGSSWNKVFSIIQQWWNRTMELFVNGAEFLSFECPCNGEFSVKT